MINGVFSINFIFFYYIFANKSNNCGQKKKILDFKYHQHTFSALFDSKFSAIVLLGNGYFLLSIKVKKVCLLFSDIS